MTPDVLAMEIAARQYSLITLDQAFEAGLTEAQIRWRIRSGRWVRVRPRVFLVRGASPSYEQTVLAACLSAGEGALASHLTAARIWGLRLPEPDAIDVLTPHDRRIRLAGVRHHREVVIDTLDTATRAAIPITSVARTLVDCSGTVSAGRLGSIVDDAVRRRLVRYDALTRVQERSGMASGRRNTVGIRTVLAKRGGGYEPLGSDRELWVLRALRDAGLPEPRPQFRVRVKGRTFLLDFAYPEPLIALEYDGFAPHDGWTPFHRDRERRRLLTAAGWRVVDITAETSALALVESVSEILARCGHPTRPGRVECPEGRGGAGQGTILTATCGPGDRPEAETTEGQA